MLRWFDEHGFVLAPNHVVERAIDATAIEAPVDAPVFVDAGREVDYGAPGGNDYERLARDTCEVSAMQPTDLAEIVRIDRGLTGRDRAGYIGRKLAEAMDESGVRVSLAARLDGAIVGFAMARADLGDFGRTDPTAVLDTIGVDREYEHRGVGHALMSQLCLNLAALRIERIETVVAPRDLGLLGFLYDVGFAPSQRIPFVRTMA
ncbi:MAG: GNAT family N-acetyltransferase [Burkholderiales bacterium]|nr:GNAT family N-acetyltransferase [Burkholderiales bacterium]